MEIKGLDYNTMREPLAMPEYGREIQNMVDHAMGIADRAERLRCAKTIVRMMAAKVTQRCENSDFEQTLWDHLYIISGCRLDIDWPYDVTGAEKIAVKPQPMPRPGTEQPMHLRHYGRLTEQLLAKIKQMPAGSERDEMVRLTANQMKRSLAAWGHGSTDDERVLADIARFTDGVIQPAPGELKLDRVSTPDVGEPATKRRRRK